MANNLSMKNVASFKQLKNQEKLVLRAEIFVDAAIQVFQPKLKMIFNKISLYAAKKALEIQEIEKSKQKKLELQQKERIKQSKLEA